MIIIINYSNQKQKQYLFKTFHLLIYCGELMNHLVHNRSNGKRKEKEKNCLALISVELETLVLKKKKKVVSKFAANTRSFFVSPFLFPVNQIDI